MESLNEALFYSLVKDDFQTAKKMLLAGANPNSIFEVQKGKFISSFNLFITKTSTVNQKKGTSNTQFKSCMQLMKPMLEKSSLECKCLKEHKCPLYIALQTFKIKDETEILEGKGDIIRYLIINGANIKFEEKYGPIVGNSSIATNKKVVAGWRLPWIDLEGMRSYLVTKKFDFVEAKV